MFYIYIYNHVVLASLQGDYHIHLKPDATPFALPPPCNVLLSMRQEVKAELECTAPTYGSSTQPDVAVCIVYLRPLNAGIIWEVHPLPTVDNILAQLSDAHVFNKLNVNSGFWQIPLDEESLHLTTFITLYGRF